MLIQLCVVTALLAIALVACVVLELLRQAARSDAYVANRKAADSQREVERLRQMHAGACERIAAASAVIARNAERSPLSRLQAWFASGNCRHEPYIEFGPFGWFVELILDGIPVVSVFGWPGGFGDSVKGVCHMHEGAGLGECLTAALDLWEQRHTARTADGK